MVTVTVSVLYFMSKWLLMQQWRQHVFSQKLQNKSKNKYKLLLCFAIFFKVQNAVNFAVNDTCVNTPCQNAGTCTNEVNTFTCHCAAGFTGNRCAEGTSICYFLLWLLNWALIGSKTSRDGPRKTYYWPASGKYYAKMEQSGKTRQFIIGLDGFNLRFTYLQNSFSLPLSVYLFFLQFIACVCYGLFWLIKINYKQN